MNCKDDKALSELKLTDQVRWQLQERWWIRLLDRSDAHLHQHIKPDKYIDLAPYFIAPRLSLVYMVWSTYCTSELFIITDEILDGHEKQDSASSGIAIFKQLKSRKHEIDASFGAGLDWTAPFIGASIRGGYLYPESEWDEIQTRQVNAMNRLHDSLYTQLKYLNI